MSGAKAACAKHEQAYAVADGCPYCEPATPADDVYARAAALVKRLDAALAAETTSDPWSGMIAWCPQPAPDGPHFFGLDRSGGINRTVDDDGDD